AEVVIRDFHVTGVQTCALPICPLETPWETRKSVTEFARFFDSVMLYSSLPVLSVCPSTRIRVLGYSLKIFARSVRVCLDFSLMEDRKSVVSGESLVSRFVSMNT